MDRLDEFFVKFRRAIAEFVAPLFSFRMKDGAWYGKQDLVELALHMAAMNGFAEGTANALRGQSDVPTSETLLAYVKTLTGDEILSNADEQIGRCVEELKAKGLSLRDVALAFDWHDEPYYGKPIAGMVGTQHKRGTCHAFSFLTASILTPKRRLTLCVLPLESRENLHILVLELLERIQRLVKGIAYVAFDNGFQDRELMEGLRGRQINFILPLRDTTRLRRRWHWVSYAKRFTYRTQGIEVDVVEAVDRRGWQYFLATNLAYSPKRVLRLYKRRWGIETSYRKIREFLPKTTSRSWIVRIFYFVLACLIYNAWIVLNARAREWIATIAIKLNYIWNVFRIYQMELGTAGG
jgi:hypothetical protein